MSSHETIKSIQLFSENFNFLPETELNSLSYFFISQTEGKRYHDAKEIFDSAYALSKKSNHRFRHLLLCLKLANNATNNYRSYQSLYDVIQLSLINTTKEPKRSLNNKCYVTNNFIRVKKKSNCLDCKQFLKLEITGHCVSNKNCPLSCNDMRFVIWDPWKK